MFRLSRLSLLALLVGFVLSLAADYAKAQCNSGVNNSQLQAQATANQALALQQAAALQAQQSVVRQSSVQINRTRSVGVPLGLSTSVSSPVVAVAPTCTSCQQGTALAASQTAPQPQFQQRVNEPARLVLAAPGLQGQEAPPGRYVLVPRTTPTGLRLAAR